jgi:hypothetical protein
MYDNERTIEDSTSQEEAPTVAPVSYYLLQRWNGYNRIALCMDVILRRITHDDGYDEDDDEPGWIHHRVGEKSV